MNDRSDDPMSATVEAYRAVFRALQAATIGNWLDLELSMAQLKTLFALAGEGSAPIGRVAELLGIGLPTASHLVERLVQEGLAERATDANDRRRALAALTPRGEQLVTRLRQGNQKQLREWIGMLSEDEQAMLRRSLESLARVAQNAAHAEPSS